MENNERLLTADIVTKLPPAATVEALRRAIADPLSAAFAQASSNLALEVFFPVAMTEWVIGHTLGHRPSVTVFLPTGEEVEAPYVSTANLVTISFAFPVSGSAVLR